MTRPADKRRFDRSLALGERLHRVIPGGAHTYAKGDDQYPADALPVLVRGNGCRVWDADGNEFIEYGMGLRAVTLGHAFEPVVEGATAMSPILVDACCSNTACQLAPSSSVFQTPLEAYAA